MTKPYLLRDHRSLGGFDTIRDLVSPLVIKNTTDSASSSHPTFRQAINVRIGQGVDGYRLTP